MTLQLEVGQTYRNREGDKVKIVSMRAATAYRYRSETGSWYTAGGRFDLDQPEHGFDLVEACPPDAPSPEAPKTVPLCEALVKAAKGMRLESSETATRADMAYLDGHNAALAEMEAEISKRFAALSVEEVAEVLHLHISTRPFAECEKAAQAIMNLVRKEPA